MGAGDPLRTSASVQQVCCIETQRSDRRVVHRKISCGMAVVPGMSG